jgi:long-chain acyl-CoA synthetase
MVETLGEVLPFAARRYGGKTALVSDGRSFTFNELEASSNAFANGLVAAGIRPGDTVTLYGPNSWQWLVAYYAIAKTGAVVNPVNVMLTPDELQFIITDCGARAVVASADKAAALMDMRGGTSLSEVVIWGDKPPAGTTPFDRWLEQGKPAFSPAGRAPKDTGAICYTSGTTGHPKGAVQSIRSIVATAKGTALMHSRTSADTVVSPLPAPHVYGSCVLNAGVLVGATLVLLPRFSEEACSTPSRRIAPPCSTACRPPITTCSRTRSLQATTSARSRAARSAARRCLLPNRRNGASAPACRCSSCGA